MIKENETHFFFEGVLHLNADQASMKLTRRETAASMGTRQVALSVAVPRALFETPQISIDIEIEQDGASSIGHEVALKAKEALSDLPLIVDIKLPE